MRFLDTVAKAKVFLRQHGRVSPRALKLQFDLDDDALEALVQELVEIQRVAQRDGPALAWNALSVPRSSADRATEEVRGERRQATVVFSDLSGYTRLNEWLDPEEVESLTRQLKALAVEVVEAHGGIVNQFVGDEVLALFGIPKAHSDDPRRATRAAQELHRRANALFRTLEDERARGLQLHTGIATGLVLAMSRDDREGRFGVTGDTVNVGARLRSLAGADEICMDEGTRAQAEIDFVLERLARTRVEGRKKPITLYRLGALRETSPVRRTSFVGRQRELRQFEAAARRVVEGTRGEILYLRGEAGIGKTRLVEECQLIAQQHRLKSHKAWVLSFGSGIRRDALRALVCSVLEVDPEEGIERRRLVALQTAEQFPSVDDALPSVNDLLDVPQRGAAQTTYAAMNPGTREKRLQETAATLVRESARKHPLVLIVEDVHWASETTLRQLASLAGSLCELPVLLVMTSRIEGDPIDAGWRSSARDTPISTIDLRGLRREDSLRLAAEYLNASSTTVEACVVRAEGNPLFLEQLLHTAEASESSDALPGSVQSVVLARLDQLPEDHRSALQSAAILGQRFSLEALRFLIEQPDYCCDAPVAHYLVRPEAGEMIFSHALIHEGIYGSLLRTRARQLHGRAAEWYASRDLALHAQHLDRAGDNRAAQAYLEAARAQMRAYRYDEALTLTKRASAVAADSAQRVAASCLEGEMHNDLGSAPDALGAFEAALLEAETPAERCRARIGMAKSMRALDRPQDAFPILEAAQNEAERAGLHRDLSELFHLRGNLDIQACLDSHERALDHARRAASPESEARALGGLADGHYVHGRMALANRYFRESVRLAREHGLGRIEVANHVMAGWSLMYLDPGKADEIRAIARESRALAERVNDPRAKLLSVSLPAWLASEYRSDLDNAEEAWNETAAIVEAIGARRFEAQVLVGLGRVAYRSGDRAVAKDRFELAVARCRETGIGFIGPMALGGLARSEDSAERARSVLAEAEAVIRAGCVGHNQPNFYRDAIYVSLDYRNWDEAERYARALADFRGEAVWPYADGVVVRARALVRYGRGERSEQLLAELDRLRTASEHAQLWDPGFALVGVA
jgi:class 3 adenylate cyclase/tetratricopeptide (TPR) repeat protein